MYRKYLEFMAFRILQRCREKKQLERRKFVIKYYDEWMFSPEGSFRKFITNRIRNEKHCI